MESLWWTLGLKSKWKHEGTRSYLLAQCCWHMSIAIWMANCCNKALQTDDVYQNCHLSTLLVVVSLMWLLSYSTFHVSSVGPFCVWVEQHGTTTKFLVKIFHHGSGSVFFCEMALNEHQKPAPWGQVAFRWHDLPGTSLTLKGHRTSCVVRRPLICCHHCKFHLQLNFDQVTQCFMMDDCLWQPWLPCTLEVEFLPLFTANEHKPNFDADSSFHHASRWLHREIPIWNYDFASSVINLSVILDKKRHSL